MDVKIRATQKFRHRNHKCIFPEENKLPGISEPRTCWQKFRAAYYKSIIFWDKSPRNSVEMWPYKSPKQIYKEHAYHIKHHKLSVHPMSKFRVIYDAIMIPLLGISIVMEPWSAAFQEDLYPDSIWTSVGHIFNGITVAVLMFNFFFGYIKGRNVVLDHKKIVKHYILGMFIFDILPTLSDLIPRRYYTVKVISTSTNLFRACRIPTLISFVDRTAEYFDFRRSGTYVVTKSVIVVLLFLNYLSCIFIIVPNLRVFIDHRSQYHNDSWLTLGRIDTQSKMKVFVGGVFESCSYLFALRAIYWNGKKPIDTRLVEEHLLEITTFTIGLFMRLIIGVVFIHYLVSKNSPCTKYFAKLSQLREFMNQQEMPPGIQEKCMDYYDYKYKRKYFNENRVNLSEKLQGEVNRYMCEKLIRSVDLFNDLPSEVIKEILTYLKHEIFLPTDEIIKAGAIGDSMFFLSSGTVAVYTPTMEEVCHLRAGSYFGEVSLLVKDKKRTATIMAIDTCEVYKLGKEPFQKCFRSRPDLFRRLAAVARKRHEEIIIMEMFNYRI